MKKTESFYMLLLKKNKDQLKDSDFKIIHGKLVQTKFHVSDVPRDGTRYNIFTSY